MHDPYITQTTLPYQHTQLLKCPLTMMFKIVNYLVDAPQEEYLAATYIKTRMGHTHKSWQIPASASIGYYHEYLNRLFLKNV